MAIDIIKKQIACFLSSEAPEVMSIKGAWGVGKTYAWNTYLTTARNQNKIALKKYSYVSLFGINSLDDLKFSIFENMVDGKQIGRKPTVGSFKANTAELLKTLGRKSLPFLPSDTTVAHYRSMIDDLAFLSLEKTLICIDDFERKGRSIEAQDILGLITQLKEQKKCKIVLILNDESLSEGSSVDYVKLREKVIDAELRFAPSAEDCADIALASGTVGTLLRNNIVKLKINNIRIIKKIEKLAGLLLPHLKSYDRQIVVQALKTLTLLTWCYYGQSQDVPDYNFVLSRTSAFSDLDEDLTMSTQQQSWCAVLRHYDNFSVDDFDLQIAGLVESGYVDEKLFKEQGDLLNERILSVRSESSFQEAWRKYHESFADNAQEMIDCLSDSFKYNARFISPVNLDGAVKLLRNLGKNRLASKIIDLYIEKRGDDPDLFNLESSLLPGQVKDPEVIGKFRDKQERLRSKKSLPDICRSLLDSDGGCEEDELVLAQATVEEYVDLFKSQSGPQLSDFIDLCLNYGRVGGTTEYQKQISDKTTEALIRIGRESRLNASRVRRFGVRIA